MSIQTLPAIKLAEQHEEAAKLLRQYANAIQQLGPLGQVINVHGVNTTPKAKRDLNIGIDRHAIYTGVKEILKDSQGPQNVKKIIKSLRKHGIAVLSTRSLGLLLKNDPADQFQSVLDAKGESRGNWVLRPTTA